MWDVFTLLLKGLPTTLSITGGALAIGLGVAVPVTMARRAHWRSVRLVMAILIDFVRAVPPIVWIFVVYYTVGSSSVLTLEPKPAATVGIGVIAAVYISEIYRGAIESVPVGQFEAIDSLALARAVGYARVIIPQSLVLVIAPVTSYALVILKDSALASVIGAQEITLLAFQHVQLTLEGMQTFAIAGVIYLGTGLLIAWAGSSADRLLQRRVLGG